MADYKVVFSAIGIALGIIGYIPYFKGIFSGKTKPHAFSWLVWGVTVAIIFVAQVVKHGGAGAWVTGATAVICFVVAFFAFLKGDRKFSRFDWMSFLAAGVAILIWILTNDPTWAVILVVLIDFFGFLPTLRKGYYKPQEDSALFWTITGFKWMFSIAALESFSLATLLYPTYTVVVGFAFAALLEIRRRLL